MDDLSLARSLGYASLAIAAAEVFAPHVVEHELGIDEHDTLLTALGVREAVAGVTILSQTRITPTLAAGLWSRVAGDAMDLALIGLAATRTRNARGLATSTLMVAGITALDIWAAVRVQRRLGDETPHVAAGHARFTEDAQEPSLR